MKRSFLFLAFTVSAASCQVQTSGLTLDRGAFGSGGAPGPSGEPDALLDGAGGAPFDGSGGGDAAAADTGASDGRLDSGLSASGGSGGSRDGALTVDGTDVAWTPDGRPKTGGADGSATGGAIGTGGATGGSGGTSKFDAADTLPPPIRPDAATDPVADAPAVSLDAEDAREEDGPAPTPDAGPDLAKDGADTSGPDARPCTLIWADEFDGDANTGVDSSKWSYATWAPGQVNNEKQRYTSSRDNVFVDGDGHLVLRARYSPNAAFPYTSGRVETNGKSTWGPGHRVEIRAKLPAGTGSFPGIVMMGSAPGVGWPQCGELAIMEQYGQDKSWYYVTAHSSNVVNSGAMSSVKHTFDDATTASQDFHVYSVDWLTREIIFQVDGQDIARSTFGSQSPFANIEEYLILSLALGGDMGGPIDNSAFPMDMVIDYVRVFEYDSISAAR